MTSKTYTPNLTKPTKNALLSKQSPNQESLQPFLEEVLYSKPSLSNLSRINSLSNISTTSDSGISSSSNGSSHFPSTSEETLSNAKSFRQITLERRHQNFHAKKKTELCKTFQLGLVCKYGDRCSFAHGVEQLREKVLAPTNYKTIKCRQYHEQGYCQYGPRCQFIHNDPASRRIVEAEFNYQRIFDSMEMICNYEKCNERDAIIETGVFLNERLNPEKYGAPRLCVFEEMRRQGV